MRPLCCVSMLLSASAAGFAARTVEEASEMRLHEFPLCQVRLLDGRLKDEQDRDKAYLLALDPDRLLHPFRVNAGLPAPGEPYGGWEGPQCEVRGHFPGHVLSACALMYASTGDEVLKAKADALVAALAKCQVALGGGYLSAFPSGFWDRLESGQPVWAPYYVIHKIMAGLYDVHVLCGNPQALEVLEGMASYFKGRLDKLPPDAIDRMLRNEFGGMSEVLHNLYGISGDPAHLELAHRFDQPEFLGPLALDYDNLTRIHGNTQIPKVIGAARRYELTGDVRYRDLALFFWKRIVDTRTYATGGSTMFEHWPEPGRLAHALGHLNHETCKTHNILKLTRHLLEWTGDVRYADFYEHALLNGILGTQGPRPGLFQYYVAMDAGYPRTFGTPDDSFWCCYGSGIESFAKLGDSIYFHDGVNLFVNLFVPSDLNWEEKGIRIRQVSNHPYNNSTKITIHMDKSRHFILYVRVPAWVAAPPEVHVNGKAKSPDERMSESWLPLVRDWRDGDCVEVGFPMALRTLALPDDPAQVAVLYGPVVLAGILDARAGQDVCIHANHEAVSSYRRSVRPDFILGDPTKPETWIAPVPGTPLHFRTVGLEPPVDLVPFSDLSVERYRLYWPVVTEGSERHRALLKQADRFAREIDRVFTFPREVDADSSERMHNLQGEKHSAGVVLGTANCYRHAESGGWFSWDLRVLPDAPVDLACTYWGSDAGRTFDILVDDHLLCTQTLTPERPGEPIEKVCSLPSDWTAGKDRVTVTFRANHETFAGGLFGCATLKR